MTVYTITYVILFIYEAEVQYLTPHTVDGHRKIEVPHGSEDGNRVCRAFFFPDELYSRIISYVVDSFEKNKLVISARDDAQLRPPPPPPLSNISMCARVVSCKYELPNGKKNVPGVDAVTP